MKENKVWLISVTEDYFDKAKYLIKSLNKFSDYKVLLYTINFETKFESDNLIKRPMNVSGIPKDFSKKTPQDKFICMSSRLKAIVNAIDNGWDNIIYLDSDMVANTNVDELFNELKNVKNAPILVEGYYQYNLYEGRGNPFSEKDGQQLCDNKKALEYPLQKRLGLHQDERTHNRQAGVVILNKNCKQFFMDCINIAFDKDVIENWESIAPWHDETIMNVMLWKYKFNYMIPYQFVDTRRLGVKIVKEFFEKVHTEDKEFDAFTKIPSESNKNKIRFFHGARDEESIKEIYKYMVNKDSCAFVTHSTEKYLDIVEYTIKSLSKFSDRQILLFTINCDAHFNYPNLKKIRLDIDDIQEPKRVMDKDGNPYVDRQDINTYKILTLKPRIMLETLKLGISKGIYLDGDMLCNQEVDDLWDYFSDVENYPLVTEGVFEIIGWGGKFYLENKLMEMLDIPLDNRTWYVQTNTILFTPECKDFILEWKSLCENKDIIKDWNTLTPYHEETLINVLRWKYKYTKVLPQTFINVQDLNSIKAFYDCELNYDEEWRGTKLDLQEIGDFGSNNNWWLKIPKTKHQVKLFHGMKKLDELKKSFEYIKNKKTRLLYIIPHLSTGGCPQVVLKRIELMKDNFDVYAVCYADLGRHWFVVQKNKINSILGNRILYLPDDTTEKSKQLFKYIEKINPHIIHLEEIPEDFMNIDDTLKLYDNNRYYKLVETCHTSQFNWNNKKFKPDKFAFISKLHVEQTKNNIMLDDVPKEVIEYPIEYKDRPNRNDAILSLEQDPNYKHVLMVGLFTPGKNQKEIFDIAGKMIDEKIIFHFVGNLALNFKHYWGEFISDNRKELPKNIVVWDEQNDVDKFYSAFDLFYFSSKLECNPLVVKEALGWKLPVLMYNLESYCGSYDDNTNIKFLNGNINDTIKLIKTTIHIDDNQLIDSGIQTSNWMNIE